MSGLRILTPEEVAEREAWADSPEGVAESRRMERSYRAQMQGRCSCGRFAKVVTERVYWNGLETVHRLTLECKHCGTVEREIY